MKNRIVTISREFGSGGRTIGKLVAQKLGIPCYDAEIIQKIAQESGFSEGYIREAGEYTPGSALANLFSNRAYGPTNEDYLWNIQYNLITDLAQNEACFIVGRCADYILKDRSDVLNVFIYADKAYRAERIVRLYGQSDKKPEDRLEDKDKRRSVNYKHSTGQNWGEMRNYDLCLNSAVFSEDTCTQLIAELAEKR